MKKPPKTLLTMMGNTSKAGLAVIPFVAIVYVTWRVISEVDWRLVQTRNPLRRQQAPTPRPAPQPQPVQRTPQQPVPRERGELLELD